MSLLCSLLPAFALSRDCCFAALALSSTCLGCIELGVWILSSSTMKSDFDMPSDTDRTETGLSEMRIVMAKDQSNLVPHYLSSEQIIGDKKLSQVINLELLSLVLYVVPNCNRQGYNRLQEPIRQVSIAQPSSLLYKN